MSMKERDVDDGHIININRYRNVLLYIFNSFHSLCWGNKPLNGLKISSCVLV